MAGEPEEEAADGQTVSADAALKLLEAEQNEAKVLGATLLLSHHHKLLLSVNGCAERLRLRAAVCGEANFLCRLLQSSVPLQRLALGLMTMLLAGTDEEAQEAALGLLQVVPFLASASKAEIKESTDATAKVEQWSPEEFSETLEVLKRLLDLLPPSQGSSELVEASLEVLTLLLPSKKYASFLAKEEVATRALAIAELLLLQQDFLNSEHRRLEKDLSSLLEALVLEPAFRGGSCQNAALQLLTQQRPALERLDEVISCCLGSGTAAQRALLQLMAGLLAAYGVKLGPNTTMTLSRLKTLLVLAAGELRIALEGYGSKEGLVAACMLLEEAVVALGKDAEMLESGNLEEVSDCLKELHRALKDIFDYCEDLPVTTSAPEELAIVVRMVAAFQLEDPRQFSSEFERAIGTFCRLEASEFKVFLPCLQELQDWHCTNAFGKVLEVARWGLEHGSDPEGMEAWRQCAMMLSEVALDAAVYLPDVFIPKLEVTDKAEGSRKPKASATEFVLSCSILSGTRLPRPVPAADANHEGAQGLCHWSRTLWRARTSAALTTSALWELTLLCASLLTSVPSETVQNWWPEDQCADLWSTLAECILSDTEVEATVARLAIRVAGFCLDRHQAWPQALVRVAHRLKSRAVSKSIESLLKNLSSDDEWELADRSAFKAVQEFLTASAHLVPASATKSLPTSSGYTAALDGMD